MTNTTKVGVTARGGQTDRRWRFTSFAFSRTSS
jgi:hypothetical protein